ncbi:MAG: hypothetical protein AB7N65_25105, partial [Vicinamibacterales bacterium]
SPFWQTIFEELRANSYADLEGAEAAAVLPVSDRLVTRIIRERLPADAPIRDVDLRADGDEQITVRFRVTRPAFFPPFTVRLRIEQQPTLPHTPVLRLRLLSHGLVALAAPAARLLGALPPGVSLNGDRLNLHIDRLLVSAGVGDVLPHLSLLELHVLPTRLVFTVRGGVPGPTAPGAPAQP